MVKLAPRSIYETDRQAGQGVGKGSGIWAEFVPPFPDPLQPDARHALSPCLRFQSVKQGAFW